MCQDEIQIFKDTYKPTIRIEKGNPQNREFMMYTFGTKAGKKP